MSSRRSLVLAAVVWLAGLHALSFLGSGPVDDEFIFWRYARNWLSGGGLAFNPGQVVEGFSAPLWLLWIAGAMALQLPPQAAWLAGAVAGPLAATLGSGLAWRALWPEARWPAPALLVALSPALAWHAAAGLGTAPMAGLLALWLASWLGSWRAHRPARGAAVWLGLAGLMRPEALVFALPFAAAEWRRGQRAWPLAAFAPALGWVAFRLVTFGRWLPVTYHVKRLPPLEELRFGLVYLAHGTATTGIGLLALAALALLARSELRGDERGRPDAGRNDPGALALPLRAATTGLLLFVAYVVAVGGDFMELGRFFVPALPVAAVLGCLGFARLSSSPRLRVGAFCLLALVLQAPQVRERPALAVRHAAFEQRWLRIGGELRRRCAPGTSVALAPIGAFGWASGLEIVDLLGLTNDAIWRVEPDLAIVDKGHHRHDAGWVLAQAPDLVVLANAWMPVGPDGVPTMVISAWERDLWEHPDFQAGYLPMALDLEGDQPLIFHLRRGSPPPAGARAL